MAFFFFFFLILIDGFLISWASSIKDGVQEPMQSPVTRTCDFWGKGKKKQTPETFEILLNYHMTGCFVQGLVAPELPIP